MGGHKRTGIALKWNVLSVWVVSSMIFVAMMQFIMFWFFEVLLLELCVWVCKLVLGFGGSD